MNATNDSMPWGRVSGSTTCRRLHRRRRRNSGGDSLSPRGDHGRHPAALHRRAGATGLTSDPAIFDLPIGPTALYDDAILVARERLPAEGIGARVVSLPSWELFEGRSRQYRDGVLPAEVPAPVAVEEASTFGWERYAGPEWTAVGMRSFGCVAPMKVVAEHQGFTPNHVVAAAREQVAQQRRPAGS